MHEFSIVNALLDMCEQNAKDHDMAKITKVEIKIGKLSGVEPHLLQSAFDTFKEGSMCDGAELLMHLQDVILHCHACQKESNIEKNVFECPHCGSTECHVVDGEEMYLMRLEME
jgi:hydrogenase nickel incorporation protein HypA/HybF